MSTISFTSLDVLSKCRPAGRRVALPDRLGLKCPVLLREGGRRRLRCLTGVVGRLHAGEGR